MKTQSSLEKYNDNNMKTSAPTKREKEILGLIADELTTKEIASQLYISADTVQTHRRNLLLKLEARNTAGLIRRAFENRFLELSS